MMASQNQYTSTYPAITEVVSGPQELISLVYGNSSTGVYTGLSFQVLRTQRRIERIRQQFTINDNATAGFGWFGTGGFSQNVTSPGTELFEIRADRDTTIAEWGFSVLNDGVYVALQNGDGDTINGLRGGNQRDRDQTPDNINDYGGVLSDYTHTDSPTTTTTDELATTALAEDHRQGVIRIDSEQNGANRFRFAFNNQSGGQINLDLFGYGYTYDVRVIEDESTAKEILAGDGYDRRVLTYGGFDNTNPNLPKDWNDYKFNVGEGELTPPA